MRRFLGIVLLSFAILQLGFRGMQRVRSEVPMWDFVSVYAAARTWIHGGNPYDVGGVVGTWHRSGIFSDRDVSYFATVYPPNSLLMLVPFSTLPAAGGMIAWLGITAGLLVLQFLALADMAQLRWGDSRALILVGATLASAPLQFGLLSGQLSIPSISLCILAFWCVSQRRDVLGGVLLGLACALKPQVGGAFVVYYLARRFWKVSGYAIVVGGVICAVALVAMRLSHIDWVTGWTKSIALTTVVGGVNDYGWTGEYRDEIMDLKMLLISILHDSPSLRIAVECIVSVLAASYLLLFPRGLQRGKRDELLTLGALSAIALLPVYHRVYDAALLTTALAWALAEMDGNRRKYARALLIPMALFLIPFDLVQAVGHRAHGIDAISKTGWWQAVIAPHYAWGLLALTIGLLLTMRGVISRSTRPSAAISPVP